MAKPSKQRPFALEFFAHGKWYVHDAFRDRPEADAMLPVIQTRVPGTEMRVRDIREESR